MFRLIRRFRRNLKRTVTEWFLYLRWRYFEITSGVLRWFRKTSQQTADSEGQDGGTTVRARIRVANLLNPLFWIREFWGFLLRFLASRELLSFLYSIPAMTFAVAPFAAEYWRVPSQSELLQRAQNGYIRTASAEQLDSAEFYLKLWGALSEDPIPVRLAECDFFERTGRLDQGLRLAEEGYLQYQSMGCLEWLCNKEFQQFLKVPDELAKTVKFSEALEVHLKAFLQQQKNNGDKGTMLGVVYVRRGEFLNAIEILSDVVALTGGRTPEAPYYLAMCHQQQNRIPEAITAAKLAADAFRERMAREKFNFRTLLDYCRCLVMAQQESAALQAMEQHLQHCTEEERQQVVFLTGDVYAAWSRRLRLNSDRSEADFFTALELLGKGLALSPQNPRLLEELSYLGCSTEVDGELLEQKLTQAMDSGVSPGIVHFIRGTRDLLKDPPDVDAALVHFRLSEQHSQSYAGLLNNLAHAISISEEGDMAAALDLVEQALRMLPDEPVIYETRGRVLLRMGEAERAIADFERALSAEALRGDAHQGLSKAYAMLGKDGESERHARLAAEILKNPPPSN